MHYAKARPQHFIMVIPWAKCAWNRVFRNVRPLNKTKGCLIANFATVPVNPCWPCNWPQQYRRRLDLLEVGELPTGPVIYLPAEDPPTAIHHRLHALGAHLSAEERQAVADGLLIQPLIWQPAQHHGPSGSTASSAPPRAAA